MQLGPFAVAQLRLTAELLSLVKHVAQQPLRLSVTDTLGNPHVEHEDLSTLTKAIAESRRSANKVKLTETITVVIGNPPYKEKAKGRGGWVESGGTDTAGLLPAWMPPADWGVGAHAKHLRNLYVYFWRWATWKVFDQNPAGGTGVVCFITMAGFLNGPAFQRMRDYLRRRADDVWVIDCSPEGHRPKVPTRVFQGVQQPVCIVLVSRATVDKGETPAAVKYRSLPLGPRKLKFDALTELTLDGVGWTDCPTGWRDPFLPAAVGNWATFPKLDQLFGDNSSGVMPGRTWVIAPDAESLIDRWDKLVKAPAEKKEKLFHPHLRNGQVGDKHVGKVVGKGLGQRPGRPTPLAAEMGGMAAAEQYGFRSFDRQWIIPDPRVINQPNPELWAAHSDRQVYATAPTDRTPSNGPALTFAAVIPDLHHYNGRGGRVFSLWQDAGAAQTNMAAGLMALLGQTYGGPVTGEDVLAYVAAVVAHPAYTARFAADLVQPGLRVPLTADAGVFADAVTVGREVIWLHTFGERFADPDAGRLSAPPRLAKDAAPRVPAGGSISGDADDMPDDLRYDEPTATLHVGKGQVERVPPAVWAYEVSGKRVLTQWFSYRKRNRDRPIIGDRRPPSPLGNILPAGWPATYTTELLNVLNVLVDHRS